MRVKTLLTDNNGQTWLNPQRRHVMGCLLVPASAANPVAVPAKSGANAGQSIPVIFEGAQNSVSEIYALMAEHGSTDAADVQARLSCFLNTSGNRQLMNRDVLVNHVFGSNLRPLPLRETIVLESQQNFKASFLNNSTSGTSSLRTALKALRIEASDETAALARDFAIANRVRKSFFQPYWLTSDLAISLAAGAAKTFFFTNTRDQWLILRYIIASTVLTGATPAGDTQEEFAFTIYDAGTRRRLSNQPVTKNTATGNAGLPWVLPQPMMVPPNTQITVEFTSLLTAGDLEVFFTFHGVSKYTGTPLWNQQDMQQALPILQHMRRIG